ncbi:MAG: stage III sporulation protein AF, partial [Clostridia bacterium]|nr:stage III sporulation protein AF [Clostridia bacterium]
MELIREWIMRIAGITALGAVCDMIMTAGNMKKYVKMVVGLVLVLAVISPITQMTPKLSNIKIPEITQRKALELKNTIAEKEYQQIVMLYGE